MRNTSLIFGLTVVFAGAWAAQAGADGPIVIFSEVAGDPTAQVPGLPPGSEFESFDRIYQSPDGSMWIMSASVAVLPSAGDEVIIIGFGPTSAGSGVVVHEGTPAPWAAGENIGVIDRNLGINDSGHYAFANNTNGPFSADEYIIFWDGSFSVVAQEGQTVPGFDGNVFGFTLNSPHILNDGSVGFRAPSTVGSLPSSDDDFLFLGTTIVAHEGVTIPGNQAGGAMQPWDAFDSQDYYHSASDGSSHIIQGDLTGSTSSDDVVVVNGLVVVQEDYPVAGMPSPVNTIREVSMTTNGDWFVRGGNDDSQDWIVYNGSVLSATGDEVPGSGGTEFYDDGVFSATYFAMTGNSLGDYVIGATTDNPDVEADAILVFNGTDVIARQGDPVDLDGNGLFDDDTFIDIFNNDDAFLTNDLMYYFTATLQDAVGGASLGQAYMVLSLGAGGCAGDDECDDEDACTDDLCDPEAEDADEFGCTNGPTNCDDENECTADSCDSATGCVNEDISADCDDNDSCTADSCDPATGCVNENVEQTLIIKQGACPAPVNPNSNGVIPILLVGNDGFNVNNIDLASLNLHRCDGEGGSASPLADHTTVEDMNHPGDSVGCGECACNDNQDSDGIDDLSLKFRTDTTLAALGIGVGNGVVTLELTGMMMNGTPFCARDCMVVVPPGSGSINATMESNVFDTFIQMTPLDLNIDSDGFADFTRTFVEGTTITLMAPITSEGRRFLRWSVNGELQGFGIRTIEVTISEDTALKAFYQRRGRVVPNFPSEGSGDLE
ncbi:MAG: hypothetical protein IID34_08970 [Planctomycetes bacterium]|nr:hypothetical protein [Planctomycetota bacterium]